MSRNVISGIMGKRSAEVVILIALTFFIYTTSAQAQTADGTWAMLNKNDPSKPPAGHLIISGDGTLSLEGMIGTWTQSGSRIKGFIYGDEQIKKSGKPLSNVNLELKGDILEGTIYDIDSRQNLNVFFRRSGTSDSQAKKQAEEPATKLVEKQEQQRQQLAKNDSGKRAKASGESAQSCVDARTNGDTLTFKNNCSEKVFVLWCGDLKYSKKKCGDGPSGGYYTQSTNIAPGKESTTQINGKYQYAACKGGISFGNDGKYKDYSDGTVTCLKR